ncbi:hypothetical protein FEV13_00445 (plasmid) [Stutzerimonas degradans]|nr:hypothetical protein FEV13_00445 [Stutzerimonas degradans]
MNKVIKWLLVIVASLGFINLASAACFYDAKVVQGSGIHANFAIVRAGWSGLNPDEAWTAKGVQVRYNMFVTTTNIENSASVDGVPFWRGALREQGQYIDSLGGVSYYQSWEICTNYSFNNLEKAQFYLEDDAYAGVDDHIAYIGGTAIHQLKVNTPAVYGFSYVGLKDGYIFGAPSYSPIVGNRATLLTDYPVSRNSPQQLKTELPHLLRTRQVPLP